MRWFRVGHGLFAIVKNLKSGLLGRPRSEDLPSDDGDNQMNGYWVGPYTGSNTGRMVLEVDDRGDHFEGCAYAYYSNASLPNTFAIIKTSNKANRLRLKAPLFPLHPQTGEPIEWQQIARLYSNQNIKVAKEAEVECEWDDQHLTLIWNTDIETFGSADLPRGQSGQPSILEPLAITTWQNFKEYVTRLEPYRYIFRGQTNTWRLRTPFHRTGRGDMRRFLIEDIPTLHRHLSGRTSHLFDLTNPIQNAAFLHLVQHHGYPTGSGLRVRAAARPHRRCRADTRTAVTRRGSGKSGGRDVA